MELRGFATAVRHAAWSLLLFVITAASSGYVISAILPQHVSTTAQVFLNTRSPATGGSSDLGVAEADRLVANELFFAQSTQVAGAAAGAVGDGDVARVRRAMTIKQVPKTDVLAFTAREPSADYAEKVANTWASSYIAAKSQRDRQIYGANETTAPASVLEPADRPTSRVTGGTLSAGALAGGSALLLALALILARERFAPRVRDRRDLEAHQGRVLGTLRGSPLEPKYKDNYWSCMASVAAELLLRQPAPHVLTVVPAHDVTSGSSAFGLARSLADLGSATLLVSRNVALVDMSNSRYEADAISVNLLDSPDPASDVHRRVDPVQTQHPRLQVINPSTWRSGQPSIPAGLSEVKSRLCDLAEIYDVIVVDSPPVGDGPDAVVFSAAADLLVVVVTLHRTPISEVLGDLETLRQGSSANHVWLVETVRRPKRGSLQTRSDAGEEVHLTQRDVTHPEADLKKTRPHDALEISTASDQ
jgi:capsular polysaccharide biosynthesis protein